MSIKQQYSTDLTIRQTHTMNKTSSFIHCPTYVLFILRSPFIMHFLDHLFSLKYNNDNQLAEFYEFINTVHLEQLSQKPISQLELTRLFNDTNVALTESPLAQFAHNKPKSKGVIIGQLSFLPLTLGTLAVTLPAHRNSKAIGLYHFRLEVFSSIVLLLCDHFSVPCLKAVKHTDIPSLTLSYTASRITRIFLDPPMHIQASTLQLHDSISTLYVAANKRQSIIEAYASQLLLTPLILDWINRQLNPAHHADMQYALSPKLHFNAPLIKGDVTIFLINLTLDGSDLIRLSTICSDHVSQHAPLLSKVKSLPAELQVQIIEELFRHKYFCSIPRSPTLQRHPPALTVPLSILQAKVHAPPGQYAQLEIRMVAMLSKYVIENVEDIEISSGTKVKLASHHLCANHMPWNFNPDHPPPFTSQPSESHRIHDNLLNAIRTAKQTQTTQCTEQSTRFDFPTTLFPADLEKIRATLEHAPFAFASF
jgi:hypothetical protein